MALFKSQLISSLAKILKVSVLGTLSGSKATDQIGFPALAHVI